MTMLVPLGVLALGAIFAGMIWFKPFFGDHKYVAAFYEIPLADTAHAEKADDGHDTSEEEHRSDEDHDSDKAHGDKHHDEFGGAPGEGALYFGKDNHVLHAAHAAPKWVKVSPFIAMLFGFIMAMWFYIWNPSLPGRLAANQKPLYDFLLNKWYFDELYDWVFVRPAKAIGRFLWKRGDGNVIDGTLNGVAMGIVPFFTRLAGKMQSGYIFTYAFAMVIGIAVLVTWMTMTGGSN
jgi:NADH-quinone oxidoreductase subunit L